MTNEDDLIARLRAVSLELGHPSTTTLPSEVIRDAADRIEALVKERDTALGMYVRSSDEGFRQMARAERLEAALRLLHDNVVLAFPTLADLGPVANARAALTQKDRTDG